MGFVEVRVSYQNKPNIVSGTRIKTGITQVQGEPLKMKLTLMPPDSRNTSSTLLVASVGQLASLSRHTLDFPRFSTGQPSDREVRLQSAEPFAQSLVP